MARILIEEPHVDVRGLLCLIVAHLDHEALVANEHPPVAADIDLLLVEPASHRALDWTRLLRDARPELPVVAVGVFPRAGDWKALELSAYLVKPFTVVELESVLHEALTG